MLTHKKVQTLCPPRQQETTDFTAQKQIKELATSRVIASCVNDSVFFFIKRKRRLEECVREAYKIRRLANSDRVADSAIAAV